MSQSSSLVGSARNHAAGLRSPEGREGTSLPARRAFVLQLDSSSDIARGEISGRVEHLSTGQRQRFQSLHALAEVLAATITAIEAPGGSND